MHFRISKAFSLSMAQHIGNCGVSSARGTGIIHMERIPRENLQILKNHILKAIVLPKSSVRSVVRALECLLSLGLPFQNCVGTIHFLRLINNLFDIFNSRNFYGKGFKGPLLPETFNKINHVLTEAKTIFVTLSDTSNNQILKGKRKLGFLGFLLNAEKLKMALPKLCFPQSHAPFPYLWCTNSVRIIWNYF